MAIVQFTVDNKGRITLPREVRELLAIKPGDQIVGRVEEGALSMASRDSIQERLWALTLDAMPADVPDTVETAEAEAALLSARARSRGKSSTDVGRATLRELGIRD